MAATTRPQAIVALRAIAQDMLVQDSAYVRRQGRRILDALAVLAPLAPPPPLSDAQLEEWQRQAVHLHQHGGGFDELPLTLWDFRQLVSQARQVADA